MNNLNQEMNNNLLMENNDTTVNLIIKILERLNNYFYDETAISPENLKLIYPYLVLNSFSYQEIKKMYKIVVEPKLLNEKEYVLGKDSFELGFVYDGLGYNTKKQFIYCLAFQNAYEKEFGNLDLFKNTEWFVNYCKENGINNPDEMMERYDIINLFYIHMKVNNKEILFPFDILERALIVLD